MRIDAPDLRQIPSLRALWREAFGDTEDYLDSFFSAAFSPKRCRAVTLNGTTAAALYWFDCLYRGKKIAYLYAVATADAYRGQGLCHSLMADTHRHLAECGYEGSILVPGNAPLFDFYGGMGYHICSHIRTLDCQAGATPAIIHHVDINEYAALRRQLLPDDGVVQEKENLAFLQTQAELYAGDGFLAAIRRENGRITGTELLGDTTAASGIVRALGYERGTFRIPGNGAPFAMYRPRCGSKLPPPVYFGLAFD